MKLSYRIVTLLFFIAYLIPIAILGILFEIRVEQRQNTLQVFLKNQADVDRQIIAQRNSLRETHTKARQLLLFGRGAHEATAAGILRDLEKIENFWKRYESSYTARERPFLQDILKETQESALIEEEAATVQKIQTASVEYRTYLNSYPPFKGGGGGALQDNIAFFDSLGIKRDAIYEQINNLVDLRYIFAQRIIFFASGESDRQQGLFGAIVIAVLVSIFALSIIEYFVIHKPFKDIMLFLKDLNQGKKGQRLYFSSIIKEVKESEEIINAYVGSAEEHEKEK